MKYNIIIGILLFALIGCTDKQDQSRPMDDSMRKPIEAASDQPNLSDLLTIKQGVYGKVLYREGNFGGMEDDLVTVPVAAKLYIFEVTTADRVEWNRGISGTNITAVNSTLIDSTLSDDAGFYQLELPAGNYSIFAWDEPFYYASFINTRGELSMFSVFENQTTKILVTIDKPVK